MAWTDEARAKSAAARKAKAKHPAKGAKVAKAIAVRTVAGRQALADKAEAYTRSLAKRPNVSSTLKWSAAVTAYNASEAVHNREFAKAYYGKKYFGKK